jgi:hypothetical protein
MISATRIEPKQTSSFTAATSTSFTTRRRTDYLMGDDDTDGGAITGPVELWLGSRTGAPRSIAGSGRDSLDRCRGFEVAYAVVGGGMVWL